MGRIMNICGISFCSWLIIFNLLLFSFTFITYIGGKMEVNERPPVVNITSISTEVIDDPWVSGKFPFIDSKRYLQDLAKYVGYRTFRHAMIVIGPKDGGKSTGISKMTIQWRYTGHIVIELNLKGLYEANGDVAMSWISRQLKAQLSLLDISSYIDIYKCTRKQCLHEESVGIIEITTTIAASLYTIVITILSVIGGLWYLRDYIQRINLLKYLGYLGAVIGGLLIVFCVGLLFLWNTFPHVIYERIQPIDSTLRHGDWTTLICYLNCISTETPENRPVLIIREIIKPSVLQETLKALERYKEDRIRFPTILETSDILWFQTSGVKKSRSSYWPYVMDYEEGKHELVTKWKIFTLEQYKKVYDVIGGHFGSYTTLWALMTHYDVDFNKSLDMLIEHSNMHLLSCLREYPNKSEIVTSLKHFKENGYIYKLTKPFQSSGAMEDLSKPLSKPMEFLIQCNILFCDGSTVVPQKKLIRNLMNSLMT